MSYYVDKCGVTLYNGDRSRYIQGERAWVLIEELDCCNTDEEQERIIGQYFDT